MIESKLYFTIGMPRCGKSTFCNEWVMQQPGRVIVSSDNIRKALHGERYNFLSETIVFAIKHISIRAHLDRGMTVMVDGTNSSWISIQRLLEIDRNAVAITFDTPEEICIQRATETNQSDLIPAIKRIKKNMELYIQYGGIKGLMSTILEQIDERTKSHEYCKTDL